MDRNPATKIDPIPIVIRPIHRNDIPGILEVYRQSQDFLALRPNPTAPLELVQQDLEISQREGGCFCGISDPQGNLIGAIDFVPEHFEGCPQQAFISLLMIAAPYRQRGFGQRVIHHIQAKIQKNTRIHTLITAVQVNNPQALHF